MGLLAKHRIVDVVVYCTHCLEPRLVYGNCCLHLRRAIRIVRLSVTVLPGGVFGVRLAGRAWGQCIYSFYCNRLKGVEAANKQSQITRRFGRGMYRAVFPSFRCVRLCRATSKAICVLASGLCRKTGGLSWVSWHCGLITAYPGNHGIAIFF